ncbi:uncharacterized protein [Aristolochia californica]|uniref:uncharacterized protein n=1 Tax=Aristolochia californica TaxID=171875 RepID=UPI0035E089CD
MASPLTSFSSSLSGAGKEREETNESSKKPERAVSGLWTDEEALMDYDEYFLYVAVWGRCMDALFHINLAKETGMSDDAMTLIRERSQAKSAEQALKELTETLTVRDVSIEEEVKSGSLNAKAIDCGLRSLFLETSNWSCLGDCYIIHSSFAVIEEKNHLETLHVCHCSHSIHFDKTVQTDVSDGFVILASPDVVQFCRFKILDMLSSTTRQQFHDGEEVIIDDKWHMAPCLVLPSLSEGRIIGVSKFCPAGEDFEHVQRLWSCKHGLTLPNEYFINIQFMHGGLIHTQWFPSAFVLRGAGLTPVPQSIRASKAISALKLFVKIVKDWDFFDAGHLKIKEVSRLGTSSNVCEWTNASSKEYNHVMSNSKTHCLSMPLGETIFSFEDLLSTPDFRTPKPAYGTISFKGTPNNILIEDGNASSSKYSLNDKCAQESVLRAKTARLGSRFMDQVHSKQKTCSDTSADDAFTPVVESSKKILHELKLFQKPSLTLSSITEIDDSVRTLRKDYAENANKEILQVSGAEGFESCLNVPGKGAIHSSEQETTSSRKSAKQKEKRNGGPVALGCREDTMEKLPKKRAKQPFEHSEITAKVFDYYSKGQLGLLSVLELKSFLVGKKAKVGGRKDDLVQRITSLLL